MKGKWEAVVCKTRFLPLSQHSWVTGISIMFPVFPCYYLDSFSNTKQVPWHFIKMIIWVDWPIEGRASDYQWSYTDWASKHWEVSVSTNLLSSKILEQKDLLFLWIWTNAPHSDTQQGACISRLTRQNPKHAHPLSYPFIVPFQVTVADLVAW